MKYSLIVPVYRNEESIHRLINAVKSIGEKLSENFETVFVVDGSPDRSFALLKEGMESLTFPVQLIAHSRNFGSFPAIRTGLIAARGEYFAVMAADLQEPPELMINFFTTLAADECDVTIGIRAKRNDPWFSRVTSCLFWGVYRRWVVPDMPEGGVDIFGCNRIFRDHLVKLDESRSSLVALIFWLGFRRKYIEYERLPRAEGTSAWTFRKKLSYMMDSIFAFTDLPIRLLMRIGLLGMLIAMIAGVIVFVSRITGLISVSGYAPEMLAILFFGALNIFGIGLVGTYAWRAYENTKHRPLSIVASTITNSWGHQ